MVKVHQRIKEEKMNIEIVDRLNQIEIQEQVRNCRNRCFSFDGSLSGNRRSAHFYIGKQIEGTLLCQKHSSLSGNKYKFLYQETDLKHISISGNSFNANLCFKKQI